ncbi:MAG: ThuA domain-containing protein [Acidobacteria bacterium]|nr:MAG: ThuA domain-containing protein [Acidobacteriota bacterium]
MRKLGRFVLILILAGTGLYLLRVQPVHSKSGKKRLLYLTLSAGFKHESIPLSRDIVKQIGDKSGAFETTFADDVSPFTAENLRNYNAVMFYTTGELPFSEVQKTIFSGYLMAGNGFIGVHSATDTFYTWDEYSKIIGGYFDGHPWHQQVTVNVVDPESKIVGFLGKSFQITDEIYQIDDFRDDSEVLLRLDPMSVDRTKPGAHLRYYNWPMAWTRKYGKGRTFYTALGHEDAVWRDQRFQQLLYNGIEWAMGELKEK